MANDWQLPLVILLRERGHEVYDFRNPTLGEDGFRWTEIDSDWLAWSPERYAQLVQSSPIAAHGYMRDKVALDWCDTCVLLLPSGRSAHLEAGYTIGKATADHLFAAREI